MASSDETATSVTLLGRLAVGDTSQSAWAEFVERYGPVVMRWCRRYGCPEPDLEDVLQEVLLKLLKAFATFQYDPQKRFRSWLSTVTRNAVTDLLRSPQQRIRATGNPDMHQALENVAANDELSSALQAEFERELFDQACKAISARVEPKTWQAFALTRDEAVTPAAAAAQLGMPLAHLYVARSRVIAHVREEVERMLAELDGAADE